MIVELTGLVALDTFEERSFQGHLDSEGRVDLSLYQYESKSTSKSLGGLKEEANHPDEIGREPEQTSAFLVRSK